jgi:hypothetical protein
MNWFNVWVDDVRPMPDAYNVLCVDAESALQFIEHNWANIEFISLDHDLGDESMLTGYDILTFIEDKVHIFGWIPQFTIAVHSDNPVGVAKMRAAIKSIYRGLKLD